MYPVNELSSEGEGEVRGGIGRNALSYGVWVYPEM